MSDIPDPSMFIILKDYLFMIPAAGVAFVFRSVLKLNTTTAVQQVQIDETKAELLEMKSSCKDDRESCKKFNETLLRKIDDNHREITAYIFKEK